jgi:hypothetical protein
LKQKLEMPLGNRLPLELPCRVARGDLHRGTLRGIQSRSLNHRARKGANVRESRSRPYRCSATNTIRLGGRTASVIGLTMQAGMVGVKRVTGV